jgi:hypothetical protein
MSLTLPTPIRATYPEPHPIRCLVYKCDALMPCLGDFKAAVERQFGLGERFHFGPLKIGGITQSLILISLKRPTLPPDVLRVNRCVFNRYKYPDLASFNRQVFINFVYSFYLFLLISFLFIFIFTMPYICRLLFLKHPFLPEKRLIEWRMLRSSSLAVYLSVQAAFIILTLLS